MLADGKIYVGTDGGKFFIVRPRADRARDPERGRAAEQHQQLLRLGGHAGADSRRRGHLARPHLLRVERRGLRHRPARGAAGRPASPSTSRAGRGQGAPAHLQVSPTELVLAPGQTVKLRARLFDDKGRFLREEPTATWSLEGLKGTVDQRRVHGGDRPGGAGGTDQGHASARCTGRRARASSRPLPWKETFDGFMPTAPCRPGGSTSPAARSR